MAAERRFRAMGSDAHFIVFAAQRNDESRLMGQAVGRVEELERRWSRFLPDSEINQLNRWAGHPVAVSAESAELGPVRGTLHRVTRPAEA